MYVANEFYSQAVILGVWKGNMCLLLFCLNGYNIGFPPGSLRAIEEITKSDSKMKDHEDYTEQICVLFW